MARLHWQPHPNHDHGRRRRSCQPASLGSSERTCSIRSRRPCGLSTRRTSESARNGSATVTAPACRPRRRSLGVEGQLLGRRPNDARRDSVPRELSLEPARHWLLRLGDDQFRDALAKERQVRAGAAANFQDAPRCDREKPLTMFCEAGLLRGGHHAVVQRREDASPDPHAANLLGIWLRATLPVGPRPSPSARRACPPILSSDRASVTNDARPPRVRPLLSPTAPRERAQPLRVSASSRNENSSRSTWSGTSSGRYDRRGAGGR